MCIISTGGVVGSVDNDTEPIFPSLILDSPTVCEPDLDQTSEAPSYEVSALVNVNVLDSFGVRLLLLMIDNTFI